MDNDADIIAVSESRTIVKKLPSASCPLTTCLNVTTQNGNSPQGPRPPFLIFKVFSTQAAQKAQTSSSQPVQEVDACLQIAILTNKRGSIFTFRSYLVPCMSRQSPRWPLGPSSSSCPRARPCNNIRTFQVALGQVLSLLLFILSFPHSFISPTRLAGSTSTTTTIHNEALQRIRGVSSCFTRFSRS